MLEDKASLRMSTLQWKLVREPNFFYIVCWLQSMNLTASALQVEKTEGSGNGDLLMLGEQVELLPPFSYPAPLPKGLVDGGISWALSSPCPTCIAICSDSPQVRGETSTMTCWWLPTPSPTPCHPW